MRANYIVRMFSRFCSICLCFLLLQSVWLSPASGSQATEDIDFSLYLAKTTFDPLKNNAAVPQGLASPKELYLNQAEAAAAGLYIVQFNGPVMDDWKQQVIDAGGKLGPYIPNYAFIAHLDDVSLPRVQGLSFVRWIGPYQPAYKLSAHADPLKSHTYRVMLAPWADPSITMQAVSHFATRPAQNLALTSPSAAGPAGGAGIQSLAADLAGDGVVQTARLGDVLWMEPVTLKKNFNNIAGGTIMGGTTAWANGYTGAGVAINVTDTGLDTGVPATIHQDFTGRVAHISSWPVVNADYGGGCFPSNGGADDGADDVDSGHGTHVTGSVAGNGAQSSGLIKGLAYQATINLQAVEQWTTFPGFCGGSGYYLTGLPLDLAPLFQEAYNWGARVQNDSWGGGAFGDYDTTSFDFDDFIYKHPDYANAVAAGNSGTDANHDGYVDLNSVSSPGTAKNVITVGASENERATGGVSAYTYGDLWPSDYTTAPTSTDKTSNSREHMAAFSSRGPMADGRIKPDVVAPGTNILSVRSSLATGSGWGSYNTYYMYMGGTSMASPLTAGAAALVRQYYIDHEGLSDPSAALIKATLINTAVDITGYGNASQEAGMPIPNNHEGWGRVNVGAATTAGRLFADDVAGLSTGATRTYNFNVSAGKPFKVSLAWSDPAASPSASITLVNNLNLRVTAPNGTTIYLGNHFSGGWTTTGGATDTRNNVENVYIQTPTAGSWKVEVIGQNVPQGPQKFALVLDGNLTSNPPGAFNKTAPNDTAASQWIYPTLTWGASAGATSYEYCVNSSASCPGAWTSAGSALSVVLPKKNKSTLYYWQVRAVNPGGTTEAAGGWWSFTTTGTVYNTHLPSVVK